jgi:putative bacteriophage DNA transposition protein A|nr:MAG TPA: transposase [Caudoviricetes sp.]
MWVNSKRAAEILGVNLRKLQRCVVKAQNDRQKFLTIDTKYFSYSYIDGIGRGGKTLQIWIDDNLSGDETSAHDSTNGASDAQMPLNLDVNSEFSRADEAFRVNLGNNASVRPLKFVKGEECGSGRDNNAAIANDLVSRRDRSRGASGARNTGASQGNEEVNAVYTVSNQGELKDGSIGLDHSGDLVTGRKNKNLDAVVNRDLRHHSSSEDNRAALTRKTLDKSEVLGYAKLYGVKAAAQAYGAKEKSIYRWQKEFAQKGGKALEDKRGGISKANVKMIKDAILSIGTAQKTSWWMEYCRRYALSKGLNFDMFAPLSADIGRSTFLRHASKIASEDYDVRAYLRGGLDVVATNIAMSRDYLKINEEWQVDATNFDFMCLDENGEQKRYTAVGFVDTASGRMVYDLCDSPNGYANVRLLKRALKKMGRPGYIKGDNGKDYVGEHFQGVLKRLGIVYVRSPKYEGRAKGKIERAHGVMQNLFEGLPGFLGHDAGQRIQREDQALEKSKRLSGVKTNISNLLTREQMQATIEEYCERMFDWSAEFEPFIFDERTFGASVIRTLQAEGFSVCGVKYVSLEVFSHIKIGEKCELIEDIDDASKFYVYKDGRYLCEVVNEEIASYTAEEVRTARKEYVRKFINPTKAYIKSLTDEMDGYQKAMAQARLAERQKGKAEVIKKDEAKVVSKIEQEASVGNNVIYLPDPADAIKSLEG